VNSAVRHLLGELRKTGRSNGCMERRSQYEALDKPALQPLLAEA